MASHKCPLGLGKYPNFLEEKNYNIQSYQNHLVGIQAKPHNSDRAYLPSPQEEVQEGPSHQKKQIVHFLILGCYY